MGNITSAGFGSPSVNVNSGATDKALRLRQGAAADWAALNPVLALGEQGLETDTGAVKVGNGLTAWSSLTMAYALPGSDAWLKADIANQLVRIQLQNATYAAGSGNPLTGTCIWSDGTTGQFNGTAVSGQPRFYSTYSFTYVGANGTRTVTQPTVTRDAGTMAITTRPALVVT